MIYVEEAGRAIELQGRSVGRARLVPTDEEEGRFSAGFGVAGQVEDEDGATILVSYEHQPPHTLCAGVGGTVLIDEARGKERGIRNKGNALCARAAVPRQNATGVPIVLLGRRPVDGDVVLLDAFFTFDHEIDDILRKIRLSDALEIAEALCDAILIDPVGPFAAHPVPAIDLKAPSTIFDYGPELGIATGAVAPKPERACHGVPNRSAEVRMKIVLTGAFDGGEIRRSADGLSRPGILGSNRRGKHQA